MPLWELRIGLYSGKEQAEELRDRIHLLLCPDPEHTSPCPIPWTTALFEDTSASYGHLAEQALIEGLLQLPPGAPVPVQPALMTEYGLSRAAVRRVMGTLRESGRVERVSGRGFRISG